MRRFRRRLHAYLTVGYLVFGAGGVAAVALGPNAGGPAAVGPHPDGTATATYGWHVTPAGAQTGLGEKPFGSALSPGGKHLAISNDGTHTQSLSMLDVATGEVTQSIDYAAPEALFVGLAWSPDGSTLYAAAGGSDKIRVYSQAGGRSGRMNFSGADKAPEQQLNQAIWASVKGPRDPMPPPIDRSGGD